jgi:AhpD family alkylhydroperoxidase
MVEFNASAATDVTGYSLLGHLSEIVMSSKVKVKLDFDKIPLFSDVKKLAVNNVFPGAVERNREAVDYNILDLLELSDAQENILFGPETSGGLLIFMNESDTDKFLQKVKKINSIATIIGEVTENSDQGMIKVRSLQKSEYNYLKSNREKNIETDSSKTNTRCSEPKKTETISLCCSEPSKKENIDNPFSTYMASINKPGALDVKTKKLISLALSISTKCESCVHINKKAAIKEGATEQEIEEAAALGIAFGGASAGMFYSNIQ